MISFPHRVTPVFAFVVGCLLSVPGAAVTSVKHLKMAYKGRNM
jgi:hypothetical protein